MKSKLFTIFILSLILIVAGCAKPPIAPQQATDYDAIVIGAGMGGLSAGTHLAVGGLKVLVLEQHHKVGGCTSSFNRGDYNFEVALHEMAGGGPGTAMGALLAKAGVADKIELIRIPDLYRSIFPGVDFTYPDSIDEAVAALTARWPKEKAGIVRLHEMMKEINTDAKELGGLYRADKTTYATTMLQAPFKQEKLVRYLFTPLQEILDDLFTSDEIKAVVSQFWVYYGPPPEQLWSILFFSANYSYLTEGAWHIKGSSQALSNAYAERITELGGTVKTGTRVTKILVENGRAYGVKTQYGETFTARYVVSNADPFQTFFTLVGEEKTPKKLAKKIKSMKLGVSLVGVYLGLDVPPSFWNCENHEIFYNASLDATENYENMLAGNYDKAACALTFYNNLGDPWYSPPGTSVLVLHTYARIADWPKDRALYQEKKEVVSNQLIKLAENVFPGLSEHIVVKEVITPRTLEAFTLQKDGIPYGWDFTPDQAIRLTNNTPIDGLYLAGSWTNPGHGVSTAQISGYQAARLILDKEGVE